MNPESNEFKIFTWKEKKKIGATIVALSGLINRPLRTGINGRSSRLFSENFFGEFIFSHFFFGVAPDLLLLFNLTGNIWRNFEVNAELDYGEQFRPNPKNSVLVAKHFFWKKIWKCSLIVPKLYITHWIEFDILFQFISFGFNGFQSKVYVKIRPKIILKMRKNLEKF